MELRNKLTAFIILVLVCLLLLPGCDAFTMIMESVVTEWLPLIVAPATATTTPYPTSTVTAPRLPTQTKPSTPTMAVSLSRTPTREPIATDTPTRTATSLPTATRTKTQTPTATYASLLEIELNKYVNWSGDLPAGYRHGRIPHYLPDMFEECPMPHNAIFQEFTYSEKPAGGVTIMLYSSMNNANAAYTKILEGMLAAETLAGSVGERSRMAAVNTAHYQPGSTLLFVDYLFQTCQMVVHIRWTDTLDLTTMEAYARSINARLAPVVCSLK